MNNCVNKSHPNFKTLSKLYGEELAEGFVRVYSKQKKALEGDFFYPSVKEFKDWLISEKKDKYKVVDYALSINPSLSKEAILGLLKGVVNKYNGAIFITKGWTTTGSLIGTAEQIETVFKPNLRIIRDLASKYPTIFRIKDTKSFTTKIVEINAPKGMASEATGIMPDTKIKEKYFSTGNTQKASDVLLKIAQSSHPLNKLAERLMGYIKINDVNIQLLDLDSIDSIIDNKPASSIGLYYPSKNTIEIAKNANVRNGLSETLILHEILHAVSYKAIRRNVTGSQDFYKLYNHAIDKFGKYAHEPQQGHYALYTEDEFFVALFTDAKFIKALQETAPVDNIKYTNLFEELINHILNMLGITQNNENLYRQAFSVATNILEYEKDYTSYLEEFSQEDQFIPTEEESPLFQLEEKEIKPGVQELFDSNFLIFTESKTSDEVISKLLSNKIIDKKCN